MQVSQPALAGEPSTEPCGWTAGLLLWGAVMSTSKCKGACALATASARSFAPLEVLAMGLCEGTHRGPHRRSMHGVHAT